MQGDCCFNIYCGICVNFYFFSYRPSCIKDGSRVHRLIQTTFLVKTYCLLVLKLRGGIEDVDGMGKIEITSEIYCNVMI